MSFFFCKLYYTPFPYQLSIQNCCTGTRKAIGIELGEQIKGSFSLHINKTIYITWPSTKCQPIFLILYSGLSHAGYHLQRMINKQNGRGCAEQLTPQHLSPSYHALARPCLLCWQLRPHHLCQWHNTLANSCIQCVTSNVLYITKPLLPSVLFTLVWNGT